MLSVSEAQQKILNSVIRVNDTENLSLLQAAGRVLAVDVIAPLDVPPWPNSAMDGYALRRCDAQAGKFLPVSQIITAGCSPSALPAGTAARIFTGAPLPTGADTVVMQENTEIRNVNGVDEVGFLTDVIKGDNVRDAGEDIKQGTLVLAAGEVLQAGHIGLLASMGLAEVLVYRPLHVALLCTGDELLAPGQPLATGKIYNSNRYLLETWLKQIQCQVTYIDNIVDDQKQIESALCEAAKTADVIISSGGVSVGDADYVKAAVAAQGELDLWKIAVKPGKPLAFGSIVTSVAAEAGAENTNKQAITFFGLPGNPVSAFITFWLFVLPYLLKQQGCLRYQPESIRVRSTFNWPRNTDKAPGSREEYLRVRLNRHTMQVEAFPNQGSGVLSSVVWADGLVKVPAGQRVSIGDELDYFSL